MLVPAATRSFNTVRAYGYSPHTTRSGERKCGRMEVRRSYAWLIIAVFAVGFLWSGLFMLYDAVRGLAAHGAPNGAVIRLSLFGGLSTCLGGGFVVQTIKGLRFFRVHIGAEGLRLRRSKVDRLLRWREIDAIVFDEPTPVHGERRYWRVSPALLLVPADGCDLGIPLRRRSPVDGRACLLLFGFETVKDTPLEVARALRPYIGDRVFHYEAVNQRTWRDMPPPAGTGAGDDTASVRGHPPGAPPA